MLNYSTGQLYIITRTISTIFVRFNVAYGAPAPREGVQPEEGVTLQGWGQGCR